MSTSTNVRKRTKRVGGRGAVTTTRTVKAGGQEVSSSERTQEVEEALECINPAYVGVNQSMTKNLGDYNSLKIGVHVSLPCEPNEEDIRRTYARASQLTSEFMDEEYEEALGDEG